ncbi:DUF445 domain-containing protein [uncultured Methylophaga sp.]|uniref:DUF445 domain-containing protein n=1 Tax=uncultured Methylophaga sp. TaxID=285271 RepID=UPI002603C55B|nr:DUF445 domain-containing protein [uncultured Methylophaga sp.]
MTNNKSLITNLLATALVVGGLFLPAPYREPVHYTGLFALAGGMTNWLAIHMLFEKVPGLYGSGVIAARFAEFKAGIHQLVMDQFFNKDNVDRFMDEMVADNAQHPLDFSDIIEQTDLAPAYHSLVDTIMESSFGSMLSMFGGKQALEPLQQPFTDKMKRSLNEIAHSESFQSSVKAKLSSMPVFNELHLHIEKIVQVRLDELTPVMVKDIIQTMIRQHLGWLVVWGGVFGGLIGLITSFLPL